jgi:hypothetical protein
MSVPDKIWATFDQDVSAQTRDVYAQATDEGFVNKPTEYTRTDLCQSAGWQPIETAPERQTILVCQSQNSIMATARGKNKHGNWRTGLGPMDYIAGVTHWMPLPDAPDRAAVCKAMGLP